MELESVAKELQMLAGRERLTAPELDRAKSLMTELKGLGMSNPEIVELTGGRWSESTLKGYTRGIIPTDPEPWLSTVTLFSRMLSENLTLANVSQAMTISAELEAMGSSLSEIVGFIKQLKEKEVTLSELGEVIKTTADLEAKGTSPDEIAGFILELEQHKVDLPSFVQLFRSWQGANLTAEDARSALNYKLQIEEAGFDIESLSLIAKASKKLGNPGEVIKSIASYGNLVQLDGEVQAKQKQLETVNSGIESCGQQLQVAGQKLEKVQKKTAVLEKALATYEGLKASGFDEKALDELARAAEKYGTLIKVIRAINRFGDLTKIKVADDELRNKVKKKRAAIKSLDEQYLHLKEPIEMCRRLLKRKFGLAALSLINVTAWRYGEPTEVMKAIEAYGTLKEIKKNIDRAKASLAEIEGKVQALNETYADYSARNTAVLDQFEELNARAIEVGRIAGSVEQQLEKDTLARDILNLLRSSHSASYDEYSPLVLVMLKSISVWANTNKSRFRFYSLVDKNIQELAGYLGGS